MNTTLKRIVGYDAVPLNELFDIKLLPIVTPIIIPNRYCKKQKRMNCCSTFFPTVIPSVKKSIQVEEEIIEETIALPKHKSSTNNEERLKDLEDDDLDDVYEIKVDEKSGESNICAFCLCIPNEKVYFDCRANKRYIRKRCNCNEKTLVCPKCFMLNNVCPNAYFNSYKSYHKYIDKSSWEDKYDVKLT